MTGREFRRWWDGFVLNAPNDASLDSMLVLADALEEEGLGGFAGMVRLGALENVERWNVEAVDFRDRKLQEWRARGYSFGPRARPYAFLLTRLPAKRRTPRKGLKRD